MLIGLPAAFAIGSGVVSPDVFPALPRMFAGGCNIKGNISVETGERIYHVPGQKFYSETWISAEKGERWFCSEAEARQAGWRPSRR